MDSFWETGADLTSANEAEVEQKVVMPLLLALGHSSADIKPKHPVIIQKGRGRNREADFVVFYSLPHNKDSALITVEAKAPGESFEKARAQAESYATAIGTPLLLITDGCDLEIWQLQRVAPSDFLLRCSLRTLAAHRGIIEAVLAKEAEHVRGSLRYSALLPFQGQRLQAIQLSGRVALAPALQRCAELSRPLNHGGTRD